jgi:hypothetical protein
MAEENTGALERAADGSFTKTSCSWWATFLCVPFTRLYNLSKQLGLASGRISTDADVRRVVLKLQQRAIPFSSLAKALGPGTTLAELARLEEGA